MSSYYDDDSDNVQDAHHYAMAHQQAAAEAAQSPPEETYEDGEEEETAQNDGIALDPATATADDLVDEETRESYRNILATQEFLARSEEDQRVLRLQQAEITDLLERAATGELGHNEYFDVSYFTSEARKVWNEREMQDRSDQRPNAVRLFPNDEEVRHQLRVRERLREDHALEDREELKKRHPLLFNRVVRDESRRHVFASAMEARREYQNRISTPNTTMPLLLQHTAAAVGRSTTTASDVSMGSSALFHGKVGEAKKQPPLLTAAAATAQHDSSTITSCAATTFHATVATERERRPFAAMPDYVTESMRSAIAENSAPSRHSAAQGEVPPADIRAAEEHMSNAAAIVETSAAAGGDVPPTLTLEQMLSQQRQQLRDLAQREEQTYRPLLASYFAYDEAVRAKLDKVLAM